MASKRTATTRPDHRRGMSRNEIREERRVRSKARKRRKRLIIMAGAFIVAALLVVSLFGSQLRRSGTNRPGLNRGGPVALAPDDGRGIIGLGEAGGPYSTVPATSGHRWDSRLSAEQAPDGAPIPWGIYDYEVPDEVLVGNLEYGGIGLHYDCPEGCPDVVAGLTDIVPFNQPLFVMSPYSDLPSKIAVTSWRHVMYLDEVDEERIREFEEAYKDRAPETIYTDR